jgi:Flp pilus assembly protein TadG
MLRHRSSPRRGQSLVEFALIAPLLFAMLFIIVELGIVFSIYVGLTNSAREAARAGSVYQAANPPTTSSSCTSSSNPATCSVDLERKTAMDQALLDTNNPIINITSPDELNPTNVRYTYQPATPTRNSYRSGDMLIVNLQYQHNLFFNLLGPPSVTIRAHSEMRIEP